ncbi:MAG: glycoside hydrolase family 172 protein [Armatimonadota bacterium]
MLSNLTTIQNRRTGRFSSWDTSGRNADSWKLQPGETRVLADISGPAQITHLWMTQANHYRECLLKITYDNAPAPSVLCPSGDFFGLGHGLVASYQSLLFSASTRLQYEFNQGCALNSYVPMPFRERCVVELVNESEQVHNQYFYVDYETLEEAPADCAYFHSEFRRANPFGGWGGEIAANKPGSHLANIINAEKQAWQDNYVILQAKGRGHYIGCNLSVTNFRGDWWGEGDDMIWVDGYKWPPDLHGTGSEDYLNQAWGMQDNAFLRNGSSIFEGHTIHAPSQQTTPWSVGGYQTSYVHHIENPVRFQKEIKVTIEHGHGNHLANEMSSVAYWYQDEPQAAVEPPPVQQRLPVLRDNQGHWLHDETRQCPGKPVKLNAEMRKMRAEWKKLTSGK